MTDNVFLALQANDDARPIVEAIEKDNSGVEVEHQPAMIRITAPGRLTIKRETVSELIGREWDPQELQLILVSFGGNVIEDEDQFTIYWNN